jgi:hypothetical protein
LGAPTLFQDEGPVGWHVVVQVLAALLRHQLAAERGFAHLARACEEHHFVGQIGLHTVIKVAFHSRYFATFLKCFVI